MDASRPSHSHEGDGSGGAREAAPAAAQAKSVMSVPPILVTRMSSLPPPVPSSQTQSSDNATPHALAQPSSSSATDANHGSLPSPSGAPTNSFTSPDHALGPRSRARPRTNATDASTQSASTSDDIEQAAEKGLPSKPHQTQSPTARDDANNGKRKSNPSSIGGRYWKRFARLVGLDPLPWYISWAPPCFTWPKLKPVIRSALLAWICMVIFLINPSERALGNASFLVLVGCFIQPAEAPLAAIVEREFFTLLFVCCAWAWSNIAIAISHAVRNNKLARADTNLQRVIQGDYIETNPSIVCAVFLSVGSAVVLYIKIRFGPGPFLFASVLSCILLNICLTYAPLYPFAFYSLGQSVVVPLAVKAAVNIILSIVFFPKSVNSQFVERLVAVLNPIADACGDQVKLLQTSPLDTPSAGVGDGETPPDESKDGFDFELVKNKLAAAEGGMMPMTMASRLLTREISFGLASGDDLKALERLSRSLIAPADGWAYYYASIKADIQSAHFPKTPVPSRLATPAITPRTSLEHSRGASDSGHASNNAAVHQPTQSFAQHRDTGPAHGSPHLHPPSRPHSPALTPLTPMPTAHSPAAGAPASAPAPATATHHETLHMLPPTSGSSTPYRESPLHSQVYPHDSAAGGAGFRQLDEHPSVQPGNEFTSSRFRKMARSIAAASRGSSPRRWIHHGHHSSSDLRGDHHHHSDGRHHHAWDRSSQLLHNFVHKRDPAPVAIWESIRFGNLETYLHTSASNYITEMFAQLIRETSSDLLVANAEAIRHIVAWLNHLNSHRYALLRDRFFLSAEQRAEKGRKQAEETSKVIAGVEANLAEFKQSRRLAVLDPYRDVLKAHDDAALGSHDLAAELDLRTAPGEIGKIHHRYLYQAWLHQFHTINFTERMLDLLREVETIQKQRTAAHIWYPHWPRIFSADLWRNTSGAAHGDDEPDGEPDHIPDITSDTPVASRQRSRSSQTVVDEHASNEGKDVARNGDAAPGGEAHAHFCRDRDDTSKGDGVASLDSIFDLGSTRARDPDALDPEGFLQVVGHTIYFWSRRPFHGNTLFGVKAAVLIALVSLPAFMKSSAGWCYENRAIWAIFMAQLTLARFRGETAFALLSRILATVIGAIFALIIWYISTGDGRGNAYGLGAVTAVAFPFLMMFRIYFPGPPITPIIASVTTALIVGYSWKDVTNPTPGAPGFGWDTAWRRFVTVVIGVSAAYIFSYLPPTSTLRQYQRLSHAATIAELGRTYCAVVGIASHPHQQQSSSTGAVAKVALQSRPGSRRPSLHHHESQKPSGFEQAAQSPEHIGEPHVLLNVHPSSDLVRKRIIAIRAKLRRLSMISVNVSYEFSLRGRWPSARYRELFDVQMQISKLLSHCLAIFERLGPAYSIALLRRTRFLDPRFLGDVVSVISMCSTALKTAEPLPQVTPCPLVDRFMDTPHGFNIAQDVGAGAVDEILATLPTKITLATLQDPEYMTFSVGVATLFGLVVRIDKLCVAVKELVGESYAVSVDVPRMLDRRNGHH